STDHVDPIAVAQVDPRLEMPHRPQVCFAPKTAVNNVIASINRDARGFLDDDVFTGEIFIQDAKTSKLRFRRNPVDDEGNCSPVTIFIYSCTDRSLHDSAGRFFEANVIQQPQMPKRWMRQLHP